MMLMFIDLLSQGASTQLVSFFYFATLTKRKIRSLHISISVVLNLKRERNFNHQLLSLFNISEKEMF